MPSNIDRWVTRKANKNHTCYWCGEEIKKGSEYDDYVMIDYGIFNIRFHPECSKARSEFNYDCYEGSHFRGSTKYRFEH